jgi:hypothetical protein
MKKILLLVILCFVFVGYAQATETLVYEEDFDSYDVGVDPTGWTDVSNNMETGLFGVKKVYKLTGSNGAIGLAYYSGSEITSLQNYAVEAAVYKNAGVSIAVVAGISNGGQNFYRLRWSQGSAKPQLEKFVNGVKVTTLEYGPAGLDWNWDYRLFKLEVNGNQVIGTIYTKIDSLGDWSVSNRTLICKIVTVDEGDILKGGAGLYTTFESSQSTNAAADFFKVYSVEYRNPYLHQTTFSGAPGGDPLAWTDPISGWMVGDGAVYLLQTGSLDVEAIAYYNGSGITSLTSYTIDSVLTKADGDGVGVVGGLSSDMKNYYLLKWNHGARKLELKRYINDVNTTLDWGEPNKVTNWTNYLYRLKVDETGVYGELYQQINSKLDWDETNLSLVDSLAYEDAGTKLTGAVGVYGVFGAGNHASSKRLRVPDPDWYPSCAEAIANGEHLKGDLNGDCFVDFKDFAELAAQWLSCNEPGNPGCN